MYRRAFIALACAAAVAAPSGIARSADPAATPAFHVGIAPHTSARIILQQYQGVRAALEAGLGRPVEILTAPDFTEFARRAVNQEYDLAVTTGHQARMLEADAGYRPLLTYRADFSAVTVVAADSRAARPTDLDGTTVLGLSPSSLVTLWGQHWLRDAGVRADVHYVSAADSVAQIVLSGDASAGFMSTANFQSLSPETRSRLRFLAESGVLIGRVYMLNGHGAGDLEKIAGILLAYAETPAGQSYFDTTALVGYRRLASGELASMDPYADEVRKVLNKADR
ncbi:MAG TPA: phosphate/phosphite/phosphonate ABC transporter substrate-binding protein [Acetobacteraceae bacterium]|jgi:phosphonate transport system substrate-binding protein